MKNKKLKDEEVKEVEYRDVRRERIWKRMMIKNRSKNLGVKHRRKH